MPREFTTLELKVRGWLDFNKTLFFILVCALSFLLLFIKKTFIISQIAAFQFMDLSHLTVFNIMTGLQYLSIPLVYAWKFTIVGFVLWVGCFMWGYRVTYRQCWQIAMIAEIVFFLPELIKIVWFMFFHTDPNYWEVKSFYPLSYMNFFSYETVDRKFWYVNMSLNVFELAYWVILTYGIDFAARKKKQIANAIVFTSYVPLFLLWLWFYVAVYE